MKLWIKRTEADIPDNVYESVVEQHPDRRIFYTKLNVFYDKPVDVNVIDARLMCEVPNYVFPEIEEGECVEFKCDKSTNKFPRIVDNVMKCIYCGKYIQYDAESIYKEAYFDTDEYKERHFYDYIECPNCHKHLPLNTK